MRACGSCFFYRGIKGAPNVGECFNRPPQTFKVDSPEGGYSFVTIRPEVGKDDFCAFFAYRADFVERDRKAAQQPPRSTGSLNRPAYAPRPICDETEK